VTAVNMNPVKYGMDTQGRPLEVCYCCERSGVSEDPKKHGKFKRERQMDGFCMNSRIQGGLMIIGSYPEREASRNNTHFFEEQRFILDTLLLNKKARIPASQVIYTYACRCRVSGHDKGPTVTQLRACKYRTMAEILHYRPRLIVAAGKDATYLFKGYTKIKDIRGTGMVYEDEALGDFKVPVCFVSSLTVFDPERTPLAKSANDEESTKRDERKLMESDFEWVGRVYRSDPVCFESEEAKAFKTDYNVLQITSSREEFDKALDEVEALQQGDRNLAAVDVETVGGSDMRITCLSFTLRPGQAHVFPFLQAPIENQERIDLIEKSYRKDEKGNYIEENGKRLSKLDRKDGKGRTKKGKEVDAMPSHIGEDKVITDANIRQHVYDRIKFIMENPRIKKVTHNGNFDVHAFEAVGINPQGWQDDTMLMYSMIDEESVRNLKALTDMYVPRLRGYDSQLAEYRIENNITKFWVKIPYSMLGPYNGRDTDATMCLYYIFKRMITEKDPADWEFYRFYAMELQKVMHDLENAGCLVDLEFIKTQWQKNIDTLNNLALKIVDFARTVDKFKTLSHDNINKYTAKMDIKTDLCPKGFKVEGNDNVAQVLLSKGIPLTKLTKTGNFQQTNEVLEVYEDHQIVGQFVKDVLEYRSVSKNNTFFKKYEEMTTPEDPKVYASFTVHGAVTGRFTVKEPNLQQVPRDSAVKNMIIAPEGYYLVQADLSQAELRILAHYADEPSMKQVYNGFTAISTGSDNGYVFIKDKTPGDLNFFYGIRNTRTGKAFCFDSVPDRPDLLYVLGEIRHDEQGEGVFKIASDSMGGNYAHPLPASAIKKEFQSGDKLATGSGDIHMFVGSKINNKKIWQLTKNERSESKSVSFGIPYGMSSYSLAFRLNCEQEDAEKLMNLYYGCFPRIKMYIEETTNTAIRTARLNGGVGIVKTELGRKRHLNDIVSHNNQRKSHARRQAVNFRIQATCHDLITNQIIAVSREIKKRNPKIVFVNQVHDSVLYYCPQDYVKEFVGWLKPVMERPLLNTDLAFPADVEIYKHCWGGEKLNLHAI